MTQLLGWVHLSDVHFGDGSTHHQLDKEQVLERLIEDLEFLVGHGVDVDYVFVTGDVTFSAGVKRSDEFDRAEEWLDRVLKTVGLDRDRLFLIPGNHDAVLTHDDSDAYKYVLQAVRSGAEKLDNLRDGPRDLLQERFAPFAAFASKFGGPSSSLGSPFHWWREIEARHAASLTIAVAGINTAVTTRLKDNEGHLQLGQSVMAAWERLDARKKILIALTHHPVSPDWLLDFASVHPRFEQRVDVHLCGHVHGLDVEMLRRGERKPMLTIVSGAAHAAEGEPVSHGYSVGSLLAQDGEAVVRVWPRFFYSGKQEFDRHAELLPRGADYSEHPLGGKAKELVASHPPIRSASGWSPSSGTRALVDELVALVDQIDHDDLLKFASDFVSELHGSLRRLAFMKQTPELTAGAYYAFLLPVIESRPPGSAIWAISTMMDVEWTQDPYEERFLRANLEAANRGVTLERIFVVPGAEASSLLDHTAVRAQVEHPDVNTLLVVRERLAESDVNLLARIGPGLIAFDDELVLVDRHNDDGRARGYGTFLAEEVGMWKRIYLELREHATPLSAP